MRNLSGHIKLFFLILPHLAIIVAYFLLKTEPFVIVDKSSGFNHEEFRVSLQNDSKYGGHSSVELLKKPGKLAYSYVLNNKVSASAIRVIMEPVKSNLMDLSRYNKILITLKSQHDKQIPVIIDNHLPSYSKEGDLSTYHPMINYIDVDTQYSEHELSLADFVTPDWWYALDLNKYYQNVENDMKQAKYIVLANSVFPDKADKDEVEITEFQLKYDFTNFAIAAAVSICIYYLIYILIFYSPLLRSETVSLLYKKIDTVNYEDSDKQVVFKFLQENFHNPELTVTDVQQATGIHERKVSGLIKKYEDTNFKQYVNQLRIEKAKEQLTQTDASISAIAYECGYNNVTHFNRVFKAQEQISPQEFRLAQKS